MEKILSKDLINKIKEKILSLDLHFEKRVFKEELYYEIPYNGSYYYVIEHKEQNNDNDNENDLDKIKVLHSKFKFVTNNNNLEEKSLLNMSDYDDVLEILSLKKINNKGKFYQIFEKLFQEENPLKKIEEEYLLKNEEEKESFLIKYNLIKDKDLVKVLFSKKTIYEPLIDEFFRSFDIDSGRYYFNDFLSVMDGIYSSNLSKEFNDELDNYKIQGFNEQKAIIESMVSDLIMILKNRNNPFYNHENLELSEFEKVSENVLSVNELYIKLVIDNKKNMKKVYISNALSEKNNDSSLLLSIKNNEIDYYDYNRIFDVLNKINASIKNERILDLLPLYEKSKDINYIIDVFNLIYKRDRMSVAYIFFCQNDNSLLNYIEKDGYFESYLPKINEKYLMNNKMSEINKVILLTSATKNKFTNLNEDWHNLLKEFIVYIKENEESLYTLYDSLSWGNKNSRNSKYHPVKNLMSVVKHLEKISKTIDKENRLFLNKLKKQKVLI